MPRGTPGNMVAYNKLSKESRQKHAVSLCAAHLRKKGYSKEEALSKAKAMYVWPT